MRVKMHTSAPGRQHTQGDTLGWTDRTKSRVGYPAHHHACSQCLCACMCMWSVVYVVAADLCSTLRPQLCVRRWSHIQVGPHRSSSHRNSPAGCMELRQRQSATGGTVPCCGWCPCLVKKVKTKQAYNITRDGHCQAHVPGCQPHNTSITSDHHHHHNLSPSTQADRQVCHSAGLRAAKHPHNNTRHP